jgi:RHS repeat-associated protein
VVDHRQYGSFGQLTSETDAAVDFLFGYTGQAMDRDTAHPLDSNDKGLYYYDARWYDAAVGRFLSEDPAADDVNLYRYCGNNPWNYTDPTGMYQYQGTGAGTSWFPSTCNADVNQIIAGVGSSSQYTPMTQEEINRIQIVSSSTLSMGNFGMGTGNSVASLPTGVMTGDAYGCANTQPSSPNPGITRADAAKTVLYLNYLNEQYKAAAATSGKNSLDSWISYGLQTVTNFVTPTTDQGKYDLIMDAAVPGQSLALSSGLAQAFVNVQYAKATASNPKAVQVSTVSSAFLNDMSDKDQANFLAYYNVVPVNTFSDVVNATQGNPVAILQTYGHAQQRQGAMVGGNTDKTTWSYGLTSGFMSSTVSQPTYIDSNNATIVAQDWKNNVNLVNSGLIIINACNLGNYTKLDNTGGGPSVPQTIADTTGQFVLTPGGYSSGLFVANPGNGSPTPTTTTTLKTTGQDYHRTKTPPSQTTPDITTRRQQAYNSSANTFYLSIPKRK